VIWPDGARHLRRSSSAVLKLESIGCHADDTETRLNVHFRRFAANQRCRRRAAPERLLQRTGGKEGVGLSILFLINRRK